jgi:hypothetical protein
MLLRIIDFQPGSWDDPASAALLGLGLVFGAIAVWRRGPIAVSSSLASRFAHALRRHPVIAVLLFLVGLSLVLATILVPPEA